MARELPARFGIKPHAARRMANRQIAIGGAMALIGAGVSVAGFGSVAGGLPFGMAGALMIAIGLRTRSMGVAVQVVNKAYNLAASGQREDAAELLDYAEETCRSRYVLRVVDVQRALAAMQRGDLAGALVRADAAVTRRTDPLSFHLDHVTIAAARSLRALLRASTSDRDGAAADIEIVRASALASPEVLARAELAAAVLLERSGDREALRAHLLRERSLLVEHTRPRERALVRAYQRMLKAKASSVYRTGAKREPEAGGELSAADWAARISPDAAPFMRAPALAAGGVEELSRAEVDRADASARAAAEGRAGSNRQPVAKAARRMLLLWVVLVMVFLGVWQLLNSNQAPPVAPTVERLPAEPIFGPLAIVLAFPIFFIVMLVGGVLVNAVRTRKLSQRFVAARVAIAKGEPQRGKAELEALTRTKAPAAAAQAYLALAELSDRQGELLAALAACEAGLARLNTEAARAMAADILLPALLAERAFVFAAMGRSADARAEMALLAERYASYPFLERARLRVALALRAREGDIAGAARLTERDADLPLNARDELLADVCRAAANPGAAGAGEVERLREELRLDAASRRWLSAIAPAALAAFERLREQGDAEAEALAETEALAEAEALAERAGVRPRNADVA
ncbi:hypothetical protein [Sorangium atrum]|uniref:Secreted protein n=1 Tax=Sorangium atrum TaxID=2995308 RepID=A0ABT5C4I9_9BACT|nr:hypothetical protein [Sorangium aterium]MDC0681334.1 hypothetical protein [Sorangium aterium]